MRIFGITEASYYCSKFGRTTGDSQGSIIDFKNNRLRSPSMAFPIREGTTIFQEYLDCSLRDVERSLFFAISHHRKSHELLFSSSSPWAFVTLYYGSWYASRAIMGLFGCAIFDNYIIDVHQGTTSYQELQLRRIGNGADQEPCSYKGSHRIYWDLFYNSVRSLVPMVSSHLAPALTPVSGDPVWLIKNRNKINYDTRIGISVVEDFDSHFSPTNFPSSLPGALSTQFHIFESLLEIACDFSNSFGLNTDALDGIGGSMPFSKKIKKWIYTNKPQKIKKGKMKRFQ